MQKIKINWTAAIVAFLLAVIVWYAVTGRERVETWVSVRLELKGLPEKFALLNSLPSRLELRLSGPSGLLSNLSSQDTPYVLNLSDVSKGKNIIPLAKSDMPFSGAFDVMEIKPAVLELDVDEVVEKTVPISVALGNKPGPGIKKVELVPREKEVVVKGAESLLHDINKIKAYVALPEEIKEQNFTLFSYLSLPPGTEGTPAKVDVDVTVEGQPKPVTLTREVVIKARFLPANVFAEPDTVEVKVEIPFTWQADDSKLEEVQAYVLASDETEQKKYRLPVKTVIPEGVKLIRVKPEKITLHVGK